MSIAIVAAAAIGEFFTALVITLFVLVAEVLEGMSVSRGRRASMTFLTFCHARSAASLKIGHPPTITPRTPITVTFTSGSQTRNHTAAAARVTNAMRAASGHAKVMLVIMLILVIVVRLSCRAR